MTNFEIVRKHFTKKEYIEKHVFWVSGCSSCPAKNCDVKKRVKDGITIKEACYNCLSEWCDADSIQNYETDTFASEIDDNKNIKLIRQALKDYEDGAIIEARDALANVVKSIDAFITANDIID